MKGTQWKTLNISTLQWSFGESNETCIEDSNSRVSCLSPPVKRRSNWANIISIAIGNTGEVTSVFYKIGTGFSSTPNLRGDWEAPCRLFFPFHPDVCIKWKKQYVMFFFFTNFPSLGTIFLGTSDPAVFTNVSPGTSQSNSITERLGKIYWDIRRNMMMQCEKY